MQQQQQPLEQQQQEEEVSHAQAMQRLVRLEKYADVYLVGSDGGQVPAVKCLLASRSPVFDKLLYGKKVVGQDDADDDNHTEQVKLPFSSQVLQRLVAYIYTDGVPRTNAATPGKLAALAAAGWYFGLPVLAQEASQVLHQLAKEHLRTAVQALNACAAHAALHDTAVCKAINKIVLEELPDYLQQKQQNNNNKNSSAALLVAQLEPAALQMLLQCKTVHVSELQLFQIVLAWSQANPLVAVTKKKQGLHHHKILLTAVAVDEDDLTASTMEETESTLEEDLMESSSTLGEYHPHDQDCFDDDDDNEKEEPKYGHCHSHQVIMMRRRVQAAKFVSRYIDLTKMSPTALDATVAPSGLVSVEQLLRAYQAQALQAQLLHGVCYERCRGPVWSSTGTTVYAPFAGKSSTSPTSSSSMATQHFETELLDCGTGALPWGAVHKWSLDIKGMRGNVYWIGMVQDTVLDTTISLHQQAPATAWSQGHDGMLHGTGRCTTRVRGIRKASTVTFTLDLLTTETGSLSASFDGGADIVLFDNLCPSSDEDNSSSSSDDEASSSDLSGCTSSSSSHRSKKKLGFVPAISIGSPSVIRFLGFE